MSSVEKKLTRWEIVGAWLHIWTPPKDVEIPPVPKRKLAFGALALAVVIGVALALLIPPLDRGKREGAAERAKQQAAAVAAETARLRDDQRVHYLTAAAGADLVGSLETGIYADAKARARAGKMDGPILLASCSAASTNVVQFAESRVYKCFVKTSTGQRGEGKDVLGSGYPFVATIYTRTRRLAWCKENPRPDEKTRGHGLANVRLSPVCAGKLSRVL